jgi:hypothetical protein
MCTVGISDVLACVGFLCDKAAVPSVVVKETPSTIQQLLGGTEENCTKSWQDSQSPHGDLNLAGTKHKARMPTTHPQLAII